jgi:uncharacterized membrane protein YidH (DUF202 family)
MKVLGLLRYVTGARSTDGKFLVSDCVETVFVVVLVVVVVVVVVAVPAAS